MATKTAPKSAPAKKVNLQPTQDRVLVTPDKAEERTASGIVLPDTAREKPQQGTVIAVGPGSLNDDGKRTAISVAAGDKVIYGKYAGTQVKIDGQEYVLLRESELLARLED
jgi:chaperonin GroES